MAATHSKKVRRACLQLIYISLHFNYTSHCLGTEETNCLSLARTICIHSYLIEDFSSCLVCSGCFLVLLFIMNHTGQQANQSRTDTFVYEGVLL